MPTLERIAPQASQTSSFRVSAAVREAVDHRVFTSLQARKGLSSQQPSYQAVLLYDEIIIGEPFGIGCHANSLRFGILDLAGAGEH